MEKKLAEFFRTECDYTSLLHEIIAAQAQLLNVYESFDQLPDHKVPATDHITEAFFLIGRLMPVLNSEE